MTKENCKKINKTGKVSKALELFGFKKDTLNIELKCEECENCKIKRANAIECNGQGTLECGGCTCNEGFKGKFFCADRGVLFQRTFSPSNTLK